MDEQQQTQAVASEIPMRYQVKMNNNENGQALEQAD